MAETAVARTAATPASSRGSGNDCKTPKGSKMPRGSKPGERRGGRQRGTPNKSTVLKNAAIAAAANNPNLSPLDILLKFMRQPDLPLELRVTVAHQALPFAHIKKKAVTSTKVIYGDCQTVKPSPFLSFSSGLLCIYKNARGPSVSS